jgi:hypothetical protein
MRLFLPLFLAFFFCGCSMRTQLVSVESVPPGATVVINGEVVGATPLQVELPVRQIYTVRFERLGFAPAETVLRPVPNGNAENFIRFGLLERVGHYEKLSPNPVRLELHPVRITPRLGEDAVSAFAARVREFDRFLENGMITPPEHRRLVDRLLLLVP